MATQHWVAVGEPEWQTELLEVVPVLEGGIGVVTDLSTVDQTLGLGRREFATWNGSSLASSPVDGSLFKSVKKHLVLDRGC